jgi:hypothetical protein
MLAPMRMALAPVLASTVLLTAAFGDTWHLTRKRRGAVCAEQGRVGLIH